MIADSAQSRPSVLLIEAGLTALSFAIALGWPRAGSEIFRSVERAFGVLARKRALSVFAIGAAAGLLRLLILPVSPIPQPFSFGDFSYLLAGDTFASGRLTNPTHPLWVHFESFHITQLPSYMSMYFPAQGLFLAAGTMLAGHPWYGVWASAALMCAAFCWMFQGWLPPRWALLGGFLAILRIALFSYWGDQYWGGAVPALGGALVLGALPRIRRSCRARDFFWMAVGMALLACSRPYEGLLVSVPAFAAVCWWTVKNSRPPVSVLALRVAPAAIVLVATVAFMAYYDLRVFGNALTLPYLANRAAYASAPHFVWQSAKPEPVYRHEVMRKFYTGWELRSFQEMQTPLGFLRTTANKGAIAMYFYFGAVLLAPLALLPWALRDRRIRFLVIASTIFGIGLVSETWLIPHYIAPFACGVYVILLESMRHLRVRRPAGLFLVRAIPVLCLILAVLRIAAQPLGIGLPGPQLLTAYGTEPLGLKRAKVLAELEKLPGGQLAIIRYTPEHNISDEWVFNRADIDHSKVAWAREMDPARNAELLQYFKDRSAWLVEPDFNPPKVLPYRRPLLPAISLTSLPPMKALP